MIIKHGEGHTIRGIKDSDFNLDVSITSSKKVISSSASTNVTIGNATIERTTNTITDPNYTVSISTSGTMQSSYTAEIDNQNIALYSDGNISRVSDGDANLIITSFYSKKIIPLNFNRTITGGQQDQFLYYNDSLLAGIESSVASLASNPNYITKNNLFSSFNVRNTNFVGSSITNLPILMSRSNRAENSSTTINYSQQRWLPISPLHVLVCGHYYFATPGNTTGRANGMVIEFVTNDNQVIKRTIVNSVQNVNTSSSRSDYKTYNVSTGELDPSPTAYGALDIQVGILNEPLPNSVGFCKYFDPIALSKDISKYGFTHVCFDQFNKMYFGLSNYQRYSDLMASSRRKYQSYFSNFGHEYIRNDSGSPKMAIINNELVYFNGVSHACIADHAVRDQINDFMTELGGGYQLTMYS